MTVDNIAWIVGVHLGTMHESQAEWIKKIKGPMRLRRIFVARNLVYLSLYETCGVSYNEIAVTFNRRHLSVISRCLKTARAWVKETEEQAAIWGKIQEAIKASIAAEQEAHAKQYALKV